MSLIFTLHIILKHIIKNWVQHAWVGEGALKPEIMTLNFFSFTALMTATEADTDVSN